MDVQLRRAIWGWNGVTSAPHGGMYEVTETAGGMLGGALEEDGRTSQRDGRRWESGAPWNLLQLPSHQPCAGAERTVSRHVAIAKFPRS